MCVRGATLCSTPGIYLVSVGSHVVVSLQWILVNYNDKLDPMEVATFLFTKYEKHADISRQRQRDLFTSDSFFECFSFICHFITANASTYIVNFLSRK